MDSTRHDTTVRTTVSAIDMLRDRLRDAGTGLDPAGRALLWEADRRLTVLREQLVRTLHPTVHYADARQSRFALSQAVGQAEAVTRLACDVEPDYGAQLAQILEIIRTV